MDTSLHYVDTPSARLAVYEHDGPGEPVVLLHGGPGVPDYLADVAALFVPRHRVIRFDQRGTGRSSCATGRYDLEDYVHDVEAVRAACRLERFHVFGHSWGGTLAQLYAARHPARVTKMCLCNSGIGVGDDWRVMERAVMAYNRRQSGWIEFAMLGLDQALAMLPGAAGDRAARRMMARVWRNYFDPPSCAPEPVPEWLAGVHSRPILATRRAAVSANASLLDGATGTGEVLIVFGQHDIYGDTTARLIGRYPRARVWICPDAGHVPWIQNRTAFERAVRNFF